MKVLSVLSAAAVASALPIHANVKIVAIDKNGDKSVQTFENVDLGDTMESAVDALNTLARPHAPSPAVLNEESSEKIHELVEAKDDVTNQLVEQGEDNIKQLTEQAKEFINQAKEFLDESYLSASDHIHKIVDSKGEAIKESKDEHKKKLRAAGNFKGKHSDRYHGKKHSGKHSGKKNDMKFKSHGAKKPCSKKLQAQAKDEDSYVESMKQWSNGLYQDVSNIDFKESFGAIRQDEGAMCAIGMGFFGGVTLLSIVGVVAKFLNKQKSVKLEEDSEAQLDEKK